MEKKTDELEREKLKVIETYAGSRSQKLIMGGKQKYVSLSNGIICALTS
jgi:hypothetical protein